MMAENTRPSVRTSGEVLVAPAVVSSKAPTIISVQLGQHEVSPQSRLELSVVPERISPSEAYLIVVSATGGDKEQLGSFAFFPPPRQGEIRKFLVRLPSESMKTGPDRRLDLSVQMLPAERNERLAVSAVRIVGARIVGG